MTHTGSFIVKLDTDTGSVLRVEKKACAGRPVRLGQKPAEGEICGTGGRYQVGGLWLCARCFRSVTQDAVAHSRAGEEQLVLMDRCLFPAGARTQISSPLCGEPATEVIGGAPACASHYARALRWHQDLLDRDREAERRVALEVDRKREEEMGTWAAQGSQIIYYLRRADGAVKIGTSADFDRRFGTLTREHGVLEILLTHCGDHPREKEMHRQFAGLALGHEWFRGEEPLLSWIVQARRRRVNMLTKMPGTVPLWHVRRLLAAGLAADPAA